MSVSRADRRRGDYTSVSNEVVRSTEFSGLAKAIHHLLLTFSDDFQIQKAFIATHFKEGTYSFNAAWTELVDAGYLSKQRVRGKKGFFSGYDFEVKEVLNRNPDSDAPPEEPKPKPKSKAKNQHPIPDEYLKISKRFLEVQQINFPSRIPVNAQRIRAGAEALDQLIRLDGHDLQESIIPGLKWILEDEFWCRQVRSISSLRKKSKNNGELKFTNVLAAMQREENGERFGDDPAVDLSQPSTDPGPRQIVGRMIE